jgi:hypothetical protein
MIWLTISLDLGGFAVRTRETSSLQRTAVGSGIWAAIAFDFVYINVIVLHADRSLVWTQLGWCRLGSRIEYWRASLLPPQKPVSGPPVGLG